MKRSVRRSALLTVGAVAIVGTMLGASRLAAEEPSTARTFDVPCPPAEPLEVGILNPPAGWSAHPWDHPLHETKLNLEQKPPYVTIHCRYRNGPSYTYMRIEKVVKSNKCWYASNTVARCEAPPFVPSR